MLASNTDNIFTSIDELIKKQNNGIFYNNNIKFKTDWLSGKDFTINKHNIEMTGEIHDDILKKISIIEDMIKNIISSKYSNEISSFTQEYKNLSINKNKTVIIYSTHHEARVEYTKLYQRTNNKTASYQKSKLVRRFMDYIKNKYIKITFVTIISLHTNHVPNLGRVHIEISPKIMVTDGIDNNTNIMLLKTNIWRYVFPKYLTTKDIYNLAKINVNTGMYDILKNVIISNIVRALKKRIYDYEKFEKVMNESGGVISGSFIMHTINEEETSYCDIDIYFSNPDKFNIFGAYMIESYDKSYDKKLLKGAYGIKNIQQIYNYQNHYTNDNNRAPIQCIVLKNQDPKEIILKEYDMDIVKNIFYYEKGEPKIYVKNIDGVITKRCNVIFNDNYKKTLKRVEKYKFNKHISFTESSCINFLKETIKRENLNILFAKTKYSENEDFQILEHEHNDTIVNTFKYQCIENCILCRASIRHFMSINMTDIFTNEQMDKIGRFFSIMHINTEYVESIEKDMLIKNRCSIVKITPTLFSRRELNILKLDI